MTTEIEAVEQQPAPGAPEGQGTFQRIGGVLFSPDETFAGIAARPNVLLPLVILLVISILGSVILVPKMDFQTMMRDQMERSGKTATMSPSDVDRAVRMSSSFAKMIGYVSPVFALAVWAIIAGVLLVTFKLFGAQGTYKQAFSVTLYAWVPLLINSIIGLIVALTKSSLNPEEMGTLVASNAAVLVDLHAHPVLYSLLSSIDLFTIWTVVLLIVGFAHVARTTKARAAAVVLSWWGVMLFVKVGFAALGAMRMKAGS